MNKPVQVLCDAGHKFYKEEHIHTRCPFCLASGLEQARKEIRYLEHYAGRAKVDRAYEACALNSLDIAMPVARDEDRPSEGKTALG